ncbi:MAG: TRAP transporter substrate-binding protein [Desulfovibrionaceae bacterium]|nr:TRAP transporter substrate-binding protein [Desulfovibrionaceae bacterium]
MLESSLQRVFAARQTALYSAFLLLYCSLLFLPAGDAGAVETRLRFANFPAAATFPCVSMERWAEEVRKRGNGSVIVETFPGGTLLEAKNMVRGVIQGQADIGCISVAYHPGAYPFLSVFELPLGFASAEEAGRVMWQLLGRHEPDELSKIKVIALFSSAPSQIMSTRPLKGPESLQGLVLRASGVLSDVAEALGASPVSMPQSDTPEALQKGVVQGVFSSFDVLKDYNFAASCRYGMVVDGPVYPFMFFMSRKKWDALPKDVQDAITELAEEHSVWTGRYVDEHGREAVRWSEETYGYSLLRLDDGQKAALREKAAPVLEAWKKRSTGKGVDAEVLLREVLAAKAEYSGKPVTE